MWTSLIKMLKDRRHIYDGLPVKCQQHSYSQNVLRTPEDFDTHCPDGGCSEPW